MVRDRKEKGKSTKKGHNLESWDLYRLKEEEENRYLIP